MARRAEEHTVDRAEQAVSDRDHGLLVAAPTHDPTMARAERAVLLPDGRPGKGRLLVEDGSVLRGRADRRRATFRVSQ